MQTHNRSVIDRQGEMPAWVVAIPRFPHQVIPANQSVTACDKPGAIFVFRSLRTVKPSTDGGRSFTGVRASPNFERPPSEGENIVHGSSCLGFSSRRRR